MSYTKIKRCGLILVLSSPSGAGKTTIANHIIKTNKNLHFSISYTTRPKRPNEVHGQDYYFVSETTFNKLLNNNFFVEYAKVFGHFYGSPINLVKKTLSQGKDLLFDVDWQGARQLKRFDNENLVSIFILPPSWKELERRLLNRSQDTISNIKKRMSKAQKEISHWNEYDYVVVNDNIDNSVIKIDTILKSERLKRKRQINLNQFITELEKKS